MIQAKESGVKVKVIDTWVSNTDSTLLDSMDDLYCTVHGADPALVFGMMHALWKI